MKNYTTALLAVLVASCGGSNSDGDPVPTIFLDPIQPTPITSNILTTAASPDIAEPAGLYSSDGYDTVDVVRLDVRTATVSGTCTPDDQSGCTLADVMDDIDGSDDFKVEIPVHFQGPAFADDGSESNAELRQRGASSRLAPQKSFRIKLDSSDVLWRNERRVQLNKHPFDITRIRNKLAFDLMSEIPHLPSMRTQFVNLWIDDGQGSTDYGLFTHIEAGVKEYLVNRGWDKDDNLYKSEKFLFSNEDLQFMQLDDAGEPVDLDQFETRLEIKRGEEHSKLIEMISAIEDPQLSFEDVLATYFDENNVLMWVTVNFLLHQIDAVTHNFYLYNPQGSDKFYFVPWDYDGAFGVEQQPANNFTDEQLLLRLSYGYAKGGASKFLDGFYRLPNIHQRILALANELRDSSLMDSNITQRANLYTTVVGSIAGQLPDLEHNSGFAVNESENFASFVSQSHSALSTNYSIPLPPALSQPVIEADQVRIKWSPAYDVTGNEISYDIDVSSTPDFGAGDIILQETALTTSDGQLGFTIDLDQLPAGVNYARLVARVETDPDRFWQIAANRLEIDGISKIGIVEFVVP